MLMASETACWTGSMFSMLEIAVHIFSLRTSECSWRVKQRHSHAGHVFVFLVPCVGHRQSFFLNESLPVYRDTSAHIQFAEQ